MPYYGNTIQAASLMLSHNSVPEPGLGNRAMIASVGATVGGGTTVNGMAITRGQKADFEGWKKLENPGWGWDSILKYTKIVGGGLRGRASWSLNQCCLSFSLQSGKLNIPSAETIAKYKYRFTTDGWGNGPLQGTFPTNQWPDVCKSASPRIPCVHH